MSMHLLLVFLEFIQRFKGDRTELANKTLSLLRLGNVNDCGTEIPLFVLYAINVSFDLSLIEMMKISSASSIPSHAHYVIISENALKRR